MKPGRDVKYLLFFLLLIVTACCGSRERLPVYKNGEVVRVTGVVSMAGNEPFARVILRPTDRRDSFFLPENFRKEKGYTAGKTITVSGKIRLRELKSGDHKYTVFEYHLIPEKIEEVKPDVKK